MKNKCNVVHIPTALYVVDSTLCCHAPNDIYLAVNESFRVHIKTVVNHSKHCWLCWLYAEWYLPVISTGWWWCVI